MAKTTAAGATTYPPAFELAPTRFEVLPVDQIAESPTNHRRTWGDMEGLVASVREKGVIEPILVRPMKGTGPGQYMVVFGARRLRATQTAGLTHIPAMVRELGDLEVVELQVVENLQRADVHPLEEAEGYELLLQSKERTYTVEEIAAKVGKSKAYVYGRMKLLALCKEAREAFYEGKLTPSVALLVARIPSVELQRKALERLVPREGDDPLSFREAARVVHDGFMLKLAGAPFEPSDAGLVKKAGACGTCPKRTGSQPELFADVESGDVCTDPVCFRVKVDAIWERRAEAARAAGRKVLDEKQAEKIFTDQHWMPKPSLSWQAEEDYDELDDRCADDKAGRTWREVLGAEAPAATVLVRDPRGGIRELVPLSRKVSLLKKAGVDIREKKASSGERGSSQATKAHEEARRRELKLNDAIETEVLARVGAAAEKACEKAVHPAFLRLLADAFVFDGGAALARRIGKPIHTYLTPKDREKALAKLGLRELYAVLAELAYESDLQVGNDDKSAILKWAKVDPKQVEAEVRAKLEPAAETTKTPAKKKGGRR